METAAKIAAVCLLGALLAALLKKTSPDTALLLALAVCVVVLTALARGLEEVTSFLRELLDWGGLSVELFVPLLKTVAIALISRVGGALCRDAGKEPWQAWWKSPAPLPLYWCHCPCFGPRGGCWRD